MSTPANKLTAELLIEIPKRFSYVRLWRNNRVDAMVPGRGGKPRRVQAGIDGQADLSGIARILAQGIRVEIEVKAGKDQQSAEQKAFQRMIESHGGIYIVARGLADCVVALRARGCS